MIQQVKIEDIENKLKDLLNEIESGKEFLITRGDKPVAKLTQVDTEENIGTKESILSLANIMDDKQAEEMISIIADGKTVSGKEVDF